MTALPSESDLTGTTRTNADMRVTHAALRAYLAGLLGTSGQTADALATLGALGGAGVLDRTTDTTLAFADRGKVVTASGSWALTLPLASEAGAGWMAIVVNPGSGTVTLTRAGADLINGAATLPMAAGTAAQIVSTGAGWVVAAQHAPSGGSPAIEVPLRPSNLTATELDPTPGRVLKVGDFGLGGGMASMNMPICPSLVSLDMPTGFYRVTGATTGDRPPGAGTAGILRVHRFSDNQFRLEFTDLLTNTTWSQRYRDASSPARSPWARLFDQGSVLGAVSQTEGLPTGALLQHGANANGRFERRASGAMVCTRTDLSVASISTAEGNIFRTTNVAWTFPSAFLAGTKPVVSFTGENVALIGFSIVAISNTAVTVRIKAASSIGSEVILHAVAQGIWSDMS